MSAAPELFELGGYKLSQSQVLNWCQSHDVNPQAYETMFVVNRWLASRNLRTRILMHNFSGEASDECSYVVITDKKKIIDWTSPMTTQFEESENSVDVRAQLGINDTNLEFVTVRKWLKTKSRKRRSFQNLEIPNGEHRGRSTTRALRV